MAKSTTTQPIPIGTATGRSDHRTNTAQLQQTTTLRMRRADPDPPRADGLLCRTVGPAFRARTAHRHRIGKNDLKTHPLTSGRGAVTFSRQSRNTFSSVHRRPMSLVQRLGTAAFMVVITGVGLSPAVEAHSAHHHHHHHSRKNKKRRPTTGVTSMATEEPSKTATARTTGAIPRCTAPWVRRCHGASSSPQRPGWFRFTRITTEPASMLGTGSISRPSVIHLLIESAKTPARPGATMC